MDYDSFSHGQIKSKLWLCEQLENFVAPGSNLTILGSWHNVLGFMLSIRRPNYYENIIGIDKDSGAIGVANKLTDYWSYGDHRIINICDNANEVEFHNDEVIINCSPEHFEDSSWFEKIPEGTQVCIQSSNMTDSNYPWLIKQPTETFNIFMQTYPLNVIQYSGELSIDYESWGYKRFMVIGFK